MIKRPIELSRYIDMEISNPDPNVAPYTNPNIPEPYTDPNVEPYTNPNSEPYTDPNVEPYTNPN